MIEGAALDDTEGAKWGKWRRVLCGSFYRNGLLTWDRARQGSNEDW